MSVHSKEEILYILNQIPDPEIPMVSIHEIGMLHDVVITNAGYEIQLMPTYTGCPAMGIIEADIKATLSADGIFPVSVKLVYDPIWTTDHMTAATKEKLRQFGIAPPLHSSCTVSAFAANEIACPHCNSADTIMLSRFGSTACKALYKCNDCKEPFEYFKCH